MSVAIKLENISKQYRLGQVGTGTISHDLNRWWHRVRGKEDPYSQVGQINRRDQAAESEYVWALRDLSFEVAKGELIGVIGPNGAGKSTLLKLISRITAPTTGEIRANGRIASLLEVGTGMHPELTARENIFLNGSILGMGKTEVSKQLDDIIDFSGCAKYVDTPIKRFSTGMQVRLGFSVAAFLSCDTLIVDEVLAVGDTEFQTRCIGKMDDIRESGRTLLLVTHNLSHIKRLCTRVVRLEHGTLHSVGPPDEVVRAYLRDNSSSLGSDSVTWNDTDAPGNHELRLLSVSLPRKNGEFLDLGTPIHIRLAFRITTRLRGLRWILRLNTEDGEVALASTNELAHAQPDYLPGHYEITCTLPPQTLNRRTYSISVEADIRHERWLLKETTCLLLRAEGSTAAGTLYDASWPGVVCPPLHWSQPRALA